MNSNFVFIIPLVSLIYFIDTLRHKRLHLAFKTLLGLFSFGILILNLLISLVFFVYCKEASFTSQNSDCIGWIYPTSDFRILIVLSLVILSFSIYGLVKKWSRSTYFLLGTIIIYACNAAMIFNLAEARYAIQIAIGHNTNIILEIFSIVVVYGLVGSLFYLLIFFLGLFTRYIPRQTQG
jgi:hypothetical protein